MILRGIGAPAGEPPQIAINTPSRSGARRRPYFQAPEAQLSAASVVSLNEYALVGNTLCEQEGLASLVLQAREGSEAALETLICRFQTRIAAFVYTQVGRDDAIEDICQNVFLKMIWGLAKLKSVESFEPWLFRIARNACRDFIRRKRLWGLLVPFESKHEQLAAVPPAREASLEKFHAALEEMPEGQRELIVLLADNDWSYEELARITRSTVSSVKSRLFRARESLRRRMVGED
jgi:RNA polymerase sigma-70 factor (ECF subfamily)